MRLFGLIALVLVGAFLLMTFVGRRLQLRHLAEQIAKLRKLAGEPLRYRPPIDGDPLPPAEPMAAMTAELQDAGCVMLGDFTEVQADGTLAGVTRWFRDATGAMVGWCGVAGTPATVPVLVLISETASGDVIGTLRGPETPSLVNPPFFFPEVCPPTTPLPDALTRHRARTDERGGAAVQAMTATDAQALMNRRLERSRDWRATQPPDRLRRDDIAKLLGDDPMGLAPRLLARVEALEGAA